MISTKSERAPCIPAVAAGSRVIALACLFAAALAYDGLHPRDERELRLSSLGEPIVCRDPIAGVWVAKRFLPALGEWEHVTLRIARDGSRLSGTITVRFWEGTAHDDEPPPACVPGVRDTIAHEDAVGTFNGSTFTFEGTNVSVSRTPCASNGTYNLDHFEGRVLAGGSTLEAVNNDGGRDVDAPHRFRRVRCSPE